MLPILMKEFGGSNFELLIMAPLPTKELSPIFEEPFTIAPVEIWQWSPTETSCSIKHLLFIMQFFPIFVAEFITTSWKIIVPSWISEFLEMYDLFETILGNLYPKLFPSLYSLGRILLSLICPTPINKCFTFLKYFFKSLSRPIIGYPRSLLFLLLSIIP